MKKLVAALIAIMILICFASCGMEASDSTFKPVFRAVICSDTHLIGQPMYRFAKMFTYTYGYAECNEFYKDIDAIVVVGDMTNGGKEIEYRTFEDIAHNNLKSNTRLITVMGNHEHMGSDAAAYTAYTGEEPDKHIVVNGYHFIGLSTPDERGNYTDAQIEWLNKELDAAHSDDPEKPIFTFQHQHLKGTVYGSSGWGISRTDDFLNAYSKYQQIINFSGHAHCPINNPRSIWQDEFTALETGTMHYVEMGEHLTDGAFPENFREVAECYIVEVNAENRVRILPFNILTGDVFHTPSNTDAPDEKLIYEFDVNDKSSFIYSDARRDNVNKPYFAQQASITCSQENNSTKIMFPTAFDDSCLSYYKVILTDSDGNTTEKSFFAQYHLEPLEESEKCSFEGLPAGKYSVNIVAVNVWGLESEPLTGNITIGE